VKTPNWNILAGVLAKFRVETLSFSTYSSFEGRMYADHHFERDGVLRDGAISRCGHVYRKPGLIACVLRLLNRGDKHG